MTTLNLSGKIDNKSIAIYSVIDKAAKELEIPYVVVGASARDLVLHYGYGARIQRATADIDFGIQIPNWETFEQLSQRLIGSNFEKTKTLHRFICKKMIIDLVPFGGVADKAASISWPPKGDIVMNVMGFNEALSNAINVIIQDKPKIVIPVVLPPGLSLLKLIAWSDRATDLKDKDAKDLLYLFRTYEDIPDIREAIFEYDELHDKFDSDIRLGSPFKLGIDAGILLNKETRAYLNRIENNEIEKRNSDLLVEDMCDDVEEEFEFNRKLLDAYFKGIHFND